MNNSVLDRLLGGRGVSWVRYEPHFAVDEPGEPEDGFQVTEDSDEAETPEGMMNENPERIELLDLRPQLKWESGSWKAILRPRWTAQSEVWKYTDTVGTGATAELRSRALGNLNLTDAYLEFAAPNDLLVTAGLFVEGWGPAEFVNPSNPFIHLSFQNKSYFYKEKGLVLIRGLWNPSAKTTLSLTTEPISNNERSFRQGTGEPGERDFESRWALRAEWQSDNASLLAGALVGQEQDKALFIGEFWVTGVEFVSLATAGQGELVTAFSWSLQPTANK
jgi:hypothetical protein